MADPFSVASGIAGLVTLADIVIERSYHYIRHCKNAAKDAQRLLVEVQSLAGILKSLSILESQVSRHAFASKVSASQRYQCQQMLENIRDKLADAVPQAATSKMQRLERVLKWRWTAEQTEQVLAEMERHKSAFNLAVSMESLEAILHNNAEQDDVVRELTNIKEILLRIELTKERKEMLEFFGTFDSEQNHAMSIELKQRGTGLWLIESPELDVWRQERNSKLWLYGIPGAGKTIIAGMLVQEALKLATPLVASAFYYCDYRDTKSRNVKNMLASIAGQLAWQSTACANILLKVYKPLPNETIRILPNTKILSDLVLRMSAHFDEVALVIDALDEADDAGNLADILSKLVQAPSSNIKLAALSRDEHLIRNCMNDFTHISIAARNSDLKSFVSAQIEERTRSKKLRIKSPGLKDEILDRLVNGADGMFRWTVCQLDHLCALPTDADRRKALATLPPDLSSTYTRILQRVDKQPEQARTLVHRVLMWLFGARIEVAALCQAVTIGDDDFLFDPEAVPEPEEILLRCSSLVRLSHDGKYIEFAHFTVQEYLQDAAKLSEDVHSFACLPEVVDSYIVRTCLTYLLMDPPFSKISSTQDVKAIYREWPFYWHASSEVLYDIGRRSEFEEGEWSKVMLLFSHGKRRNLATWVLLVFVRFCCYEPEDTEDPEDTADSRYDLAKLQSMAQAQPLQIACCLGSVRLVTWLLEQPCDVDENGPLRNTASLCNGGYEDDIGSHLLLAWIDCLRRRVQQDDTKTDLLLAWIDCLHRKVQQDRRKIDQGRRINTDTTTLQGVDKSTHAPSGLLFGTCRKLCTSMRKA